MFYSFSFDWQLIALNSFGPLYCLELSFKQKFIHIFWIQAQQKFIYDSLSMFVYL